MLTKEKVENYKTLQEEVNSKIEEVLSKKAKIERGKDYDGEITEIEFFKGFVEITTTITASCSCCGDEYDYFSFPERFLYEDWEEEYTEEVRLKKEAKQKEKEEEARIAKEKKEKIEREKYEELKKKFEKS